MRNWGQWHGHNLMEIIRIIIIIQISDKNICKGHKKIIERPVNIYHLYSNIKTNIGLVDTDKFSTVKNGGNQYLHTLCGELFKNV